MERLSNEDMKLIELIAFNDEHKQMLIKLKTNQITEKEYQEWAKPKSEERKRLAE